MTKFSSGDNPTTRSKNVRKRISARLESIRIDKGEESSALCESLRQQLDSQETELRLANERVDHLTKDLQKFVSAVSHDLRNPLRTISGFSELLREECLEQLDDNGKDHIARIVGGAARLGKLFASVSEYSQVYSKGASFCETDLNEVFDDAISDLHEPIKEAKAVVTRDALPLVMGDQIQLTQLLRHLIDNSIQFRSDSPQIHVTSCQDGDRHLIKVSDNGIGIAEKNTETAFEIFRRFGYEQKDLGGAGAGLAICRHIVERHGGTIQIESELGVGTTVLFSMIPVESS